MSGEGKYCSKTLSNSSGKFMLNGLWNADNSAAESVQDHGYGAFMYLDYLINAYGNNPKIIGKIWENIKNGDSVFNSIKKALNVTFWYKNWGDFVDNYFSNKYECWSKTNGWILHKDITERWTISDTTKDYQHEFKDKYYELSAKTKLIELKYDKKGFEKDEKPTMNFSISGTANDISACVFDYLKGTEIGYVSKINGLDIKDLSLYPKGTILLVAIINNDFSGKTDTQEITLKVKITSPHIDSISPNSGNIGSIVTIKGRDFGKTQVESKVIFSSNKIAPVSSWSDTEIKVKVPTGAVSGPVYVVVGNKKSNEVSFKVGEEGLSTFKRCEIIFCANEYMVDNNNNQAIFLMTWNWPPYGIGEKGSWSNNTFTASWEEKNFVGKHIKGDLTVTLDASMSKVLSFSATNTEISSPTPKTTITEKYVINGKNIPLSLKSSEIVFFNIQGTEACKNISFKHTVETDYPYCAKPIKYECTKDSHIDIALIY